MSRGSSTAGQLKEINHRLLLGSPVHPRELKPLVASFADAQVESNIRPGARDAIARDKSAGRRLVLATASYTLYSRAIAERLGFDDVIGTGSIIGLDSRVHALIDGENCYGPAKRRMIADWVEKSGLKGKHGHVRFYSDHVSDAAGVRMGRRAGRGKPARQAPAAGGGAGVGGRGLGLASGWPAPRDLNPQPPGSKPGALSS